MFLSAPAHVFILMVPWSSQLMNKHAQADPCTHAQMQAFALHPGMVMTDVTRTLPRWVQYGHRVVLSLWLLTPIEGEFHFDCFLTVTW